MKAKKLDMHALTTGCEEPSLTTTRAKTKSDPSDPTPKRITCRLHPGNVLKVLVPIRQSPVTLLSVEKGLKTLRGLDPQGLGYFEWEDDSYVSFFGSRLETPEEVKKRLQKAEMGKQLFAVASAQLRADQIKTLEAEASKLGYHLVPKTHPAVKPSIDGLGIKVPGSKKR